jgi:Guanosine polyphosphate pyrophosphohydrolases/synthetases
MANNYLDTTLFDKAAIFAVKAHKDTERRGKGFPYIIHPMEAAEIVAEITSDPEILAAAVLHDTVEDTDITLDDLRREFGDRVADLVESESEPEEQKDLDWRSRKMAAIEKMKTSTRDEKIVAIGDKLSNMRAIWRDYNVIGDKLWDRFHAPGGKADHAWRYRQILSCFEELSDTFPYKEFKSLVESVFD